MGNFEVPDEILEVLGKRNFFLIIGHQNPDGDCLSSQKALGSFLTRMGKKVSLLSPGPFDRPEIESQKKYFISHLPENIKKDNPLVIVVDCSTIERIGYLAEEIKGLDVAVIDHHDSGASFGSIKYIRPEAPSVTFLIHRIIESFNEKPTKEEAELLLFGIATDTGFFRHLEAHSEELFQSVAKLTAAGASPKDAFSEMYGGRTLKSRLLTGRILTSIRSELDGKLLITYETKEDIDDFGKENRDSDSLYQQLLGIAGVEAIALIRYEDKNEISVGLRSKYYADVGSIAKNFGGGGHKKASGFTWKGSTVEITETLITIFNTIL